MKLNMQSNASSNLLKEDEVLLRESVSLCPECLQLIPLVIFERDGKVLLRKQCKEHGEVEDVYWGDSEIYKKASRYDFEGSGVTNPNVRYKGENCPFECGLCSRHKSHTALANIVLTNRCDMACWYCFFYAKEGEPIYEPSLDQFRQMFRNLKNEKPVGSNAVQLTGGEPTLREDLTDVIKIAREEGFDHVQLNTNGIKLSSDPELARKVRAAGTNTLYMSFDGVTPKTNPKNYWEAPLAIENCRKAGLGIVLVPTVIKSINDHELGGIIKFASKNIDTIRGVNFQPVSLVGRVPRKERERFRITIPDCMKIIEEQTEGQITKDDWYPVPCTGAITDFVEALTGQPKYKLSNHFACGMATYVFKEDGKLLPLPQFVDVDGFFEYLEEKADELKKGKSKFIVGGKMLLNLNKFIDKDKQPKGFSVSKLLYNALVKHDYSALGEFHHKTLFLGMMHFQDLYNYDIQRVERCDIHYAMPDGKIVPFCAFNVIPQFYRDKTQKEYSIPSGEWEKKTGMKLKDGLYRRDVKKLDEQLKAMNAYAL